MNVHAIKPLREATEPPVTTPKVITDAATMEARLTGPNKPVE